MKLRSALLAATVLAAPVAAKAEAISGLYIGAGAGANFLQNETIKSIGFPNLGIPQTNLRNAGFGNTKARFDTGFVGLASIGYGLGNGLRIEGEGSYRSNKFNRVNSGGTTLGSAGGDERKYGGMLNVLYDFDPNVLGLGFFPAAISPYVGVGVGYQWRKIRIAGSRTSWLRRLRSGMATRNCSGRTPARARSPIRASSASRCRSGRFPAWRLRSNTASRPGREPHL